MESWAVTTIGIALGTLAAFAITSLTSVITSWSATRVAPVSLLGARE